MQVYTMRRRVQIYSQSTKCKIMYTNKCTKEKNMRVAWLSLADLFFTTHNVALPCNGFCWHISVGEKLPKHLWSNSFGSMGLNCTPLFLLIFTVKPFPINSREIELVNSHNERQDLHLQSLIFRSNIWYVLHVLWYSASVGFFNSEPSTFLDPWFG